MRQATSRKTLNSDNVAVFISERLLMVRLKIGSSYSYSYGRRALSRYITSTSLQQVYQLSLNIYILTGFFVGQLVNFFIGWFVCYLFLGWPGCLLA